MGKGKNPAKPKRKDGSHRRQGSGGGGAGRKKRQSDPPHPGKKKSGSTLGSRLGACESNSVTQKGESGKFSSSFAPFTSAHGLKVTSLSHEALALCRYISTALPPLDPGARSSDSLIRSKLEVFFLAFHGLLVHCAVHGLSFGSGKFGVCVIFSAATVVWFVGRLFLSGVKAAGADSATGSGFVGQGAAASPRRISTWGTNDLSEQAFSFVVPFLAFLGSLLLDHKTVKVGNAIVRAPPNSPPEDEIQPGPSFAWLLLPAVVLIASYVAIVRFGVSQPSEILSWYTREHESDTTLVSPTNSDRGHSQKERAALKEYEFASACLANHDANMKPPLVAAAIRVLVRSFSLAFWVVIAPLILQTWDPLYYNKTLCAIAFSSTFLGCLTIGIVDLIFTRLPRLVESIRLQGFWEKIGKSELKAADPEEWDPSKTYEIGCEVRVQQQGSSDLYFRAATLCSSEVSSGQDTSQRNERNSRDRDAIVFSNPCTLNASVVRLLGKDAPKIMGLLRLAIFGALAAWSALLLLCCIRSHFWMYYAGLVYGSILVFYMGAERKLPLNLILSMASPVKRMPLK